MPTSIRHIVEKLKSFIADEAFYTASLLILVAVASFGLGRQSVIEAGPAKAIDNKGSIILSEPTNSVQNISPTPLKNTFVSEGDTDDNFEEVALEREVVASKSGTKYHLPTCGGAKTIKPENLITFASIAEAEAAGYTPAANCKGLSTP